jgi:dihydroorotate dehydrogenase
VIVPRIKQELAACLQRDGFASVEEAVGADHPTIRRPGKKKAEAKR